MAFYFLRTKNFAMAEKTCHLLLEIGPHDLTVLGFMTEAMIGMDRWDEALEIGLPLIEVSSQVGELPDQMEFYLVKKMADHLLEHKDCASAVHLWEVGVNCKPWDVNALLELSQALLLVGDKSGARQRLAQASALAPRHQGVQALLRQIGSGAPRSAAPRRRH